MLLSILIQLPLYGIFLLSIFLSYNDDSLVKPMKITALFITIVNLVVSLVLWMLFDNNQKHFQFIQEQHKISYYDFYLGVDSLSIYFILLTTLIMPIAIISNWKSITERTIYFLIIILLLESALLLIFSVLDILMFYIFFESILAPLFILIGVFGSSERIRASFYFFLYTFLGSLFMLLSIITMLSSIGCTDIEILSKTNFVYITQVFMFIGIFIALAVKTPVIYLNGWLLKAHVESPLSGSIILAAIVLKLSLYGVFRLVLPLVPKAFISYTYIIFVICVLTIIYASLSTIRTIDVKELIAYSSVSHAAVYLGGILSNTLHGIVGGIALGLAHGFVSSGLFITAGGILYDRSGTRLITYYGGIAQVMPLLGIFYFILSLGNCGAPLTLNFVGEFMSLYGMFERLPLAGILGSSSIVFSAAYTIFMFNRIAFGGSYTARDWKCYIPDLNKREYGMLLVLVLFTVALGIYPSIVLDSVQYTGQYLLYGLQAHNVTHNDYTELSELFIQQSSSDSFMYLINKLKFAAMVISTLIMLISIYVIIRPLYKNTFIKVFLPLGLVFVTLYFSDQLLQYTNHIIDHIGLNFASDHENNLENNKNINKNNNEPQINGNASEPDSEDLAEREYNENEEQQGFLLDENGNCVRCILETEDAQGMRANGNNVTTDVCECGHINTSDKITCHNCNPISANNYL